MRTAYIETSVIGYLTSRPNRDLVVAAHQQLTREWWEHERQRFRCVISSAVVAEIAAGDAGAAAERLEAVEGVEVLADTPEVGELAREYQRELRLPPKAANDALHIALAVAACCASTCGWRGQVGTTATPRLIRDNWVPA